MTEKQYYLTSLIFLLYIVLLSYFLPAPYGHEVHDGYILTAIVLGGLCFSAFPRKNRKWAWNVVAIVLIVIAQAILSYHFGKGLPKPVHSVSILSDLIIVAAYILGSLAIFQVVRMFSSSSIQNKIKEVDR